MKRRLIVLFLLKAAFASTLVAADAKADFDGVEPGQLPSGWKTGITGRGESNWEVVSDADAPSRPNALKQSGKATFCWAVDTGLGIRDGFAEARIKPLSGREDQSGGLVWRFQDADNYYVVRLNALEDNVVLYKTEEGRRSSLRVKGRLFGYGVDTEVPASKWSVLRVEFKGDLFTVYFDGDKLFEVEDDTFQGAGAVGLWTKADSVTLFDDFAYGAAPR